MQTKLIIIIMLLVSACQPKNDRGPASVQTFDNRLIPGGYPLSEEEKSVALRICYALKHKRLNLINKSLLSKDFNYKFSRNDCDGKTSEETFTGKIKKKGKNFFITTKFEDQVFSEVITDNHRYIVEFCNETQKGNTPMNTIDDNGELIRVSFFEDIHDYFELHFAHKGNDTFDSLRPYKIQRYQVLTNKTASGPYLGIISKGIQSRPCGSNSLNMSELRQELID